PRFGADPALFADAPVPDWRVGARRTPVAGGGRYRGPVCHGTYALPSGPARPAGDDACARPSPHGVARGAPAPRRLTGPRARLFALYYASPPSYVARSGAA